MTYNLGPIRKQSAGTTSSATPIAASAGVHFGVRSYARPLAGLAMVALIVVIIAVTFFLYRGGGSDSIPVTVLSPRAGLVMNPQAKVELRGVQVGRVSSIEEKPNGQAAIHLAIDPSQLEFIPANVHVDIQAPTLFGAKFIRLVTPADPSEQPLRSGQLLGADHVTVEPNTLFQQLLSTFSAIDPAKLNEVLGALATAVNGRGSRIGRLISESDNILAELQPSLGNLRHDFAIAPEVLRAYGDVGSQLLAMAENAAKISQTLVDEQGNLDAVLVGVIGLADIGNDVVGTNRQPLTDVLHLMVPTTDLLNTYSPALNCSLAGMVTLSRVPPSPVPGAYVSAGFPLGAERYRYPGNLPKVAATGGPHCEDQKLPVVPPGWLPPSLVTDQGANPWNYGNQGVLLNSDALKQLLFGPIDGPPRNSAQIGQPG